MRENQRAWAEVNLNRIEQNIISIRKHVRPETKIMAVVKADAYGHGFLRASKSLIENGADYLAVACIDEAIQLRHNNINVPILILGYTSPDRAVELVNYNIYPTVYDLDFARALSRAAVQIGRSIGVHVKIDTGMARIGFLYGYGLQEDQKTVQSIHQLCQMPGIVVEGIFTHFSKADEEDPSQTFQQFEKFMDLNDKLRKNGINIKIKHCCNSAATIRFPQMHLDMVRPGLILYGLYPSECCKTGKVDLKPAMELKTRVIHIKEVGAGVALSYGGSYVTTGKTKIATLPIGYGDGYQRALSNRAEVLVNGQKAPIIGKICMDQCMIDVTNVNTISVGDLVTVFGEQKGEMMPVERLAELTDTINYEILCMIGKRIPRIYFKDGKVAEILNYLM